MEVVPNPKTIKHYRELGYEAKFSTPLIVKNEDLTEGSDIIEERICDCCNRKYSRPHRFMISIYKKYGKDICQECMDKISKEKAKQTNLLRYGTEYTISSPIVREKAKETNKKRYGYENPMQSEKVREKAKKTNMEKYGVENIFESKDFQEKIKKTNKEKYGVENVSQAEEIKEKKRKTTREHYGVDYPLQSKQVLEKTWNTMFENGNIPISEPQMRTYELCKEMFPEWKIEVNVPLKELTLDIKLVTSDNKIIDIEYDGWYWHRDKIRDRKRDEIIKKYGYKIIRIRSGNLIPTKEQLQESINYVLQEGKNFSRITLDDWVEPE